MAVVTLYMSDRDQNKTFSNKKEADEYDKMLELAENVSIWMEKEIDGLSESQSEAIGMLLAENKETLLKALKGKPEVLIKETAEDEDKVTKLSA
ncbi:YebG family protein [Aliikangiella sp. G2MR2-5]|uniref:YebG family protein n=1 Tax=Aliikangiella sp. G2MR2-5 TaxID=2788943 RepID=UPI0018AA5BE6|nr:YebG family protein [Aliikangiella sp. G2MR2-5]